MSFVVFFIGLAVGSFLNVWIWRNRPHPVPLPKGEGTSVQPPLPAGEGWGEGSVWRDAKRPMVPRSAWRGRSYCPKCKKPLRWFELIPLVSFVAQWARCRGCRGRIDIQYPLVELATGLLFVLAVDGTELSSVQSFAQSLALIVTWYLLAVLVILFIYDLRYGLVPDRVVLPAIVVALIVHATELSSVQSTAQSLALYSLAIVVGTSFFAVQYYLSKGRWLGAGDIRIGALMGAMLGWPLIVEGLVVSYMLGGLTGVILLATGRKKFGQTVPLGTFLTIGTVITFLYGKQIWEWYWG